jgi:membrane protease subunit HflC
LSEIVRSSNIINEHTTTENDSQDQNIAEIKDLVNDNNSNEDVNVGRAALCRQMADDANKQLPEYGIELLDIVPRQIKYSDELTESVYNRMIKERNQVAQAYRSRGQGKKAEWLGKLENDKRTIQSEAYRISEETKGKADAEAARIYAQAYNQDPEFYSFWKSMESYKNTLGNFDATYSTNMDYFRYLYSADGKR